MRQLLKKVGLASIVLSVSKVPRYLIVGSGITGLSVLAFLKHRAICSVFDTRVHAPNWDKLQQQFPQVDFYSYTFPIDQLMQFDYLVLSPGVSPKIALVQQAKMRGIKVINDIDLFCLHPQSQQLSNPPGRQQTPIIAITGSNGKSTVTTLVAELLNACGFKVGMGGNIGIPALNLLQKPADVYVLELSSFQLEVVQHLTTQSAVVLNITPDHLDRHNSFAEYCAIKQRIYQYCAFPVKPKGTGFVVGQQRFYQQQGQLMCNQQVIMAVNELSPTLQTTHNIQNTLAALALCSPLVTDGAILATGQGPFSCHQACLNILKTFQGLPHRCQSLGCHHGVQYYNDSKATNIGATIAAVESLAKPKANQTSRLILLLGGQDKGHDFSILTACCQQFVDQIICFGNAGDQIFSALHTACPCEQTDKLKDAIVSVKKIAQAGDLVLLSPACASFDEFDNYQERGQAFIDAVLN